MMSLRQEIMQEILIYQDVAKNACSYVERGDDWLEQANEVEDRAAARVRELLARLETFEDAAL